MGRRQTWAQVLVRAPEETAAEHEARVAAWMQRAARSRNTQRGYALGWRCWAAWAAGAGVDPVAPSEADVASWLASEVLRGQAPGSIHHYLVGMRRGLMERGNASRVAYGPSVVAFLDGLRRERPVAARQVKPVTAEVLRRCLAALPRLRDGSLTATGLRDRALLLVGYCGGLRRSELAGLNWGDLEWHAEKGLVLRVRGKTEQYGAVYIGLGPAQDAALCPLSALRAWRPLSRGVPVFSMLGANRGARMHAAAVARVVKSAVRRCGLDPDQYGGHSLRAGLVTDLAPNVEAAVGMRQTRHKSVMMWGRYYRPDTALSTNYTQLAGL